jgi:AraC-like DNA-binding protein
MNKNLPKYSGYLWIGHFFYLGRISENTEHAHHALQVIVNREGRFRLRIDGSTIDCGGVVIGPDCPHQLLSSSDSQVHLLIDRESEVAKAIAKQHLGEGSAKILTGALLKKLRGCIDGPGNYLGSCAQARDVYRNLVSELDGYSGHAEQTVDPRIQAVLDLLREKYLSPTPAIAELASHACLSESRLMHLFIEQIGIPLRRYVLWQRVMTAVQFAVQGESLTEAAHNAGFSDSAHLSRTFRRMYGITLSKILKNSRFIQVIFCPS